MDQTRFKNSNLKSGAKISKGAVCPLQQRSWAFPTRQMKAAGSDCAQGCSCADFLGELHSCTARCTLNILNLVLKEMFDHKYQLTVDSLRLTSGIVQEFIQ
jgi:hypothetical protein